MNDANLSKLESYEELLCKLEVLIGDFQKGNMKLSDAIEKYSLCVSLISECQSRINKITNARSVKESTIDDSKLKNINFEDNINKLEKMVEQITKDDITLLQIQDIDASSKRFVNECNCVLDNFSTVIEYKNQ